MRPEKLLDAIGLVDDRFFAAEKKPHTIAFSKKLIALIAAILIFTLFAGTALAVNTEFRELVFSIFHIETHEQPPAGKSDTLPPEDSGISSPSGLQEIDIVDIDGVVHAHYFSSDGIVLTYDGGFYTCSRSVGAGAPDDAVFWEIRPEGIVNVGSTRLDFPLIHGNSTVQIIFDYAIVNGKLCIKTWPQALDEDPVGNGLNIVPIGGRTDVALVSFPVYTGTDYSHDFLLLDLETQECSDLLESIPRAGLITDACWTTGDLHYAILMGIDIENRRSGYWFCDLEQNSILSFTELTGSVVSEPYFLDDNTIIFQQSLGDGLFNIVRRSIPSGEQHVVMEKITRRIGSNARYRGIQRNGGGGTHGLLFYEDGSLDLIDLRTGVALNMTGLDVAKLVTSENPDGTRILITYEEANGNGELGYGFSELGILNPETGILQMLSRDISGSPESFRGWLDSNTVVITAQDNNGGYYVYVYEFTE